MCVGKKDAKSDFGAVRPTSGDSVETQKLAFPSRNHEEEDGAPGGIRTPDTQFRRLVMKGMAACSLLFVNVRDWPESAACL